MPFDPSSLQAAQPGPEPLARSDTELDLYDAVVRGLLSARTTLELERVLVQQVWRVLHARWATCYRLEQDEYVHRGTAGLDHAVAGPIPRAVVRRLLQNRTQPLPLAENEEIQQFCPAAMELAVPVQAGEYTGLLLLGPRAGGREYRDCQALLSRVVASAEIALRGAGMVDHLRNEAVVDYLTGCYNRRGFEVHLRTEISRAQRYKRSLVLVLLDLDRFKLINDRLGHPAGDHALRTVGQILQSSFRTSDRVCRFGGDEFALIFPETYREEGVQLAERLRTHVRDRFPDELLAEPVTTSIGVAAFPDDAEDAEDLVRAADRALYQAKFRGRNQVATA